MLRSRIVLYETTRWFEIR